jgi:hypothetical protein
MNSKKKKKEIYELNYCSQDSWTTKLPWAKSIMGV